MSLPISIAIGILLADATRALVRHVIKRHGERHARRQLKIAAKEPNANWDPYRK